MIPVLVTVSPFFKTATTAASGFVTLGSVLKFTSIFAVTTSLHAVNFVFNPSPEPEPSVVVVSAAVLAAGAVYPRSVVR